MLEKLRGLKQLTISANLLLEGLNGFNSLGAAGFVAKLWFQKLGREDNQPPDIKDLPTGAIVYLGISVLLATIHICLKHYQNNALAQGSKFKEELEDLEDFEKKLIEKVANLKHAESILKLADKFAKQSKPITQDQVTQTQTIIINQLDRLCIKDLVGDISDTNDGSSVSTDAIASQDQDSRTINIDQDEIDSNYLNSRSPAITAQTRAKQTFANIIAAGYSGCLGFTIVNFATLIVDVFAQDAVWGTAYGTSFISTSLAAGTLVGVILAASTYYTLGKQDQDFEDTSQRLDSIKKQVKDLQSGRNLLIDSVRKSNFYTTHKSDLSNERFPSMFFDPTSNCGLRQRASRSKEPNNNDDSHSLTAPLLQPDSK